MSLKQDVHDRLWHAFERWHQMSATGVTKHDLKMAGLRQHGDVNHLTRGLIFTGNTLRSYESVLKAFVESTGAHRLEEIGKRDFRAFMDRAIEQGLAVKTLHRYRSALAKFGALTGQTRSFAALSDRYGDKIRELAAAGTLAGPSRATPSPEVAQRAVAILRDWDARHFARTDQPRAYHLAARLQLETSCRSISATSRVTAASLRDGNRIVLVGKGGKELTFTISAELHARLKAYLAAYTGPLAKEHAYQSAYARAIEAAGGRVTGTHGLRRLSVQAYYADQYRVAVGSGLSPGAAADLAAGNAIERLGHSRNRADHRRAYLGR